MKKNKWTSFNLNTIYSSIKVQMSSEMIMLHFGIGAIPYMFSSLSLKEHPL